jgi:hypothetical protein
MALRTCIHTGWISTTVPKAGNGTRRSRVCKFADLDPLGNNLFPVALLANEPPQANKTCVSCLVLASYLRTAVVAGEDDNLIRLGHICGIAGRLPEENWPSC